MSSRPESRRSLLARSGGTVATNKSPTSFDENSKTRTPSRLLVAAHWFTLTREGSLSFYGKSIDAPKIEL